MSHDRLWSIVGHLPRGMLVHGGKAGYNTMSINSIAQDCANGQQGNQNRLEWKERTCPLDQEQYMK